MTAFRLLFAASILSLVGCGSKIKYDQTLNIDTNYVHKIAVTSPSENHKVHIEISSDNAFTAYVAMSKDLAGKDVESLTIKPANAIAGVSKVTAWSMDVVIPTKEEFVLCIVPEKEKVTAKVKMTSQ